MICRNCGGDNPEGAESCSLCNESLGLRGPGSRQRGAGHTREGSYVSPAEWRGVAGEIEPPSSEAVERKVRGFRMRFAVLAAVSAMVVVLIALSFTVWGNPTPEERSTMLLEAVNARDVEAFLELFRDSDRPAAEGLYQGVVSYLGDTGGYIDVGLSAERPNEYEAYAYLDRGSVEAAGFTTSINRSDNLVIALENQGGRWYVVPKGTVIIP